MAKLTYNEGIFALYGDVSDLAIFAEGSIEILRPNVPADSTHIDLGVP